MCVIFWEWRGFGVPLRSTSLEKQKKQTIFDEKIGQ